MTDAVKAAFESVHSKDSSAWTVWTAARNEKWLSVGSMALALIVFSLVFEGSVTPVYAEEAALPVFGEGKVTVRLYTDYFCPPCRAMEPDVEPIVRELVKKNRISVTFIDTPLYQHSSLYARYYLYAINEKREIEHALATRVALIGAAKQSIGDAATVEAFLADRGIRAKPFDAKPILDLYSRALKEDGITSTPTCVIESGGKKEKAVGGPDIVTALKNLR